MSKRIAFAALIAALLVTPAMADTKLGSLVLSGAWARATPPGARVAGAYLTIRNDGTLSDSSSAAAKSELHLMKMDKGIMTMRPVADGLEIPAGEAVMLSPNGFHIMLVRPTAPLKAGATVPLHLTFATAGSVDIELTVEPIGASGPVTGGAAKSDDTMPGMKMAP
jgi:copper(I)-binding protein